MLTCLALFLAAVVVFDACVLHFIGPAVARVQAEQRRLEQERTMKKFPGPQPAPPTPFVTPETQTSQRLEWESADEQPVKEASSNGPKETSAGGIPVKILSIEPGNWTYGCEWLADGKRAVLLNRSGWLVEISVPECKVLRTLRLRGEFRQMALSQSGLLVADRELANLILVDPDSLQARRKIHLPLDSDRSGYTDASRAGWLAGSPGSAVVFAKAPRDGPLWIIDLTHDKLIKQPVHGEVRMIAATPDGRYLFCSDSQCLHRLSIDGTELVHDAAGPPISGYYPMRIEISNDSTYVALVCSDGDKPAPGHPAVPYAAYVYETGNLAEPVVAVPNTAYCMTWDSTTGRIFSHDREHPLVVFGPEGGLQRKLTLPEGGLGTVFRLRVHPDGGKLLVLTTGKYYWVDLSASP